MSIPSNVVITEAVLGAIRDLPACGVVVYGSVAAGTATTSSDLDTLILTEHDLAGPAGEQLREDFIAMQLRLGLQPDRQHPVELFSLAAATGALAKAKAALQQRHWHQLADDSDEREIVRALSGARWVLRECPQLTVLIRCAEDLARLSVEVLS